MSQEQWDADPWESIGARFAAFRRLEEQGALTEAVCMACGYPTLSERGGHHICVVCHWEDDGTTRADPDRRSMVNHGLSLRQAAAHIAETGVFASRWHAFTAPEYFLPSVREARAALMTVYERLLDDPYDTAVRAEVRTGRAALMRAIVKEMR